MAGVIINKIAFLKMRKYIPLLERTTRFRKTNMNNLFHKVYANAAKIHRLN